MSFYNLDEVRSLSILDVCHAYGIEVSTRGNFIKLRDEKTASCKLYFGDGNDNDSFYDFGSHQNGDVIKLVSVYTGCSWQEALESLASTFGIAPVNNTQYMDRNELSDLEWRKLGVYGDRATKNFDFDLEKYSIESVQRFSDKYGIPVNQLRKEYPNKYMYDIIKKRAIPHVYRMRNDYYFHLYNHLSAQLSILGHFDLNNMSHEDLQECKDMCKQLTQAESLLRKALKGTDVRYQCRQYDVLQDLTKIYKGEISFEIGKLSYAELKSESRLQGVDLRFREVSVGDYVAMDEYGINSVGHAAFLKNDKVNIVFLPEHSALIDKCIGLYEQAKQPISPEKDALGQKMAEKQRSLLAAGER